MIDGGQKTCICCISTVHVRKSLQSLSVLRVTRYYRGREVHSPFSFAVRGSPSFVPRVFRSCFAVRGSCFAVRGSRFVLRGSRFAVICASHFTFVLRGSRFLIRGSYFLVRASQFAVRSSWFVVVLEQGGGSIYHRLFLRRKCAEQSECPVRRVTVDGMF